MRKNKVLKYKDESRKESFSAFIFDVKNIFKCYIKLLIFLLYKKKNNDIMSKLVQMINN